jgi:hypothetical protein
MPSFTSFEPLLASPVPLPPLLAVDLDTIIFLLAGLFGVISWLYKVLTGQANQQPPVGNRQRPPVKPRDPQLQKEIDIFLEDVGQARKPMQPPARPGAARGPMAGGGPRPARPAKALPQRGAGKPDVAAGTRRQQPAPQESTKARRVRPGQEVAQRQAPGSHNLGEGMQRHVQQYMAEKISAEVKQHIANRVEQSVAEHLGSAPPIALAGATPALQAPAARIAQLMRNPESMRQAMIVNMVLAPRRRVTGAGN